MRFRRRGRTSNGNQGNGRTSFRSRLRRFEISIPEAETWF